MDHVLAISKALGDATRLRAVLLLREGELCVCQLIDVLGLAPSTVSKHMTLLHDAGLVTRRKEGKWHYYRLAGDDAPPVVRDAIAWAIAGVGHHATARADQVAVREAKKKELDVLCDCYH